MVKPLPYKAICKKCGTSKIVSPKSDALNPLESFPPCPKCGQLMVDREKMGEFNVIDWYLHSIKNIFDKLKYPKF